MSDTQGELIERIQRAATKLPTEVIVALASAIETAKADDAGRVRAAALSVVAEPSYRSRAVKLLDTWQQVAPDLGAQAFALALRVAACCEEHHRRDESVELVWTGPTTDATALRRTDQALLQVIDAAQERLTIVSFAVYKVPKVAAALVEAARRSVALRIILETGESGAGKNEFDTIKALGAEVGAKASVYMWPLDKRPKDASGRHGSLHAKCAVADGRYLFVSSANLTEFALTLNMELGVLVKGGPLPGRVEAHFSRLIEQSALVRV